MPPSNNDKTYDALIVGGGVIGLSCGLAAARRGLSVAVLERDEIAAGATGVAAGMLAPVGEATWGEASLLELALEAARVWPGFASQLEEAGGSQTGYRREGALHVALDRDEAGELRRRFELHRSSGLSSEWLRPSACRELEPGLAPGVAGGLFAPEEASVDPVALSAALAAAMRAAGGDLRQGCEVTGIELDHGRITGLVTDEGTLAADAVVLAAGPWSGAADWLPREARPPVRPVKGQILTLRGPGQPPICRRIVAGERFYAVPRGDGRLVVGATVEEQGFDTAVTAGGILELLRESYRALPDVAELELESARAGLRPGTPDNAPLIGPGPTDGLFLATGHYRNGVLLAPVTGDAIAAMLAGERPAVDVSAFAADRFTASGSRAVPSPEALGRGAR